GPIGLGIMEFARIAGAQVIAMDMNEGRLAFCKNNLGIAFTINPSAEDPIQRLREITNGDMPSLVADATGSLTAIKNGFNYLAHGARYLLVGLQRGEISFSHPEFHKREATLMSSRNATREDFDYVMNCMKKGLLNPANYITHTVAFQEVKHEFANWLDPGYGTIKAIINMDQAD
ncbi:MAG: zinc-binding dehydrogenase, partial [Flavitalea sp.]